MNYQSLLLAAAFAIVVSAAVHAEDKGAAAVPKQEFEAKVAYCKTCHGVTGQGFRGAFPMPRLAGQQPEYLQNQLQAFIERRRTNPVMFNVAHVLSPPMLTALATHFKDLNPKPLGGAPKELVAAGKKSMKTGFPALRFLHVLPVTGKKPKAPMHFLAWQASSMTTSTAN